MNYRKAFSFVVAMIFLSQSCFSEKAPSGWQVIKNVSQEMYVIGERTGYHKSYDKALSKGKKRIKEVLEHPDYDPLKDMKEGMTILAFASERGYYSIVETILNTEKGLRLLEIRAPTLGFSPLDFAKLRFTDSCVWAHFDVFSLLPHLVNLEFYEERRLYDKTIEILRKFNAEERYSTKEIWLKCLETLIKDLESRLEGPKKGMKEISCLNSKRCYLGFLKSNHKDIKNIDLGEKDFPQYLKSKVKKMLQEMVRSK